MKLIVSALFFFFVCAATAQEVETYEETFTFSNGSHPALAISIPYGSVAIAEKIIRSELKDWDGTYDNKNNEFSTLQASLKGMGGKPFDAYCRVIQFNDKTTKILLAIDLGGAYLDAKIHKTQFAFLEEKFKKIGVKIAVESLNQVLENEQKVLRKMEREKEEHLSNMADAQKAIENYKEKIKQAEQRIAENEKGAEKKRDEIKTQNEKIKEIEERKSKLK